MTELIGDWLMNSVGCNIKFTPEMLGKACFDGKLFAQILVSYNIISSEYLKLINTAVGDEQALSNLKKLCIWFKLLGISITDEFLNEIAKKSGSACLKLLYDLYNRLENRENMCYMDGNKQDRLLSESTGRFDVFHVTEKEPMSDMVDEKQYLHDILSTMKGVMQSAEKATVKRFLMDGIKHRASVIKKKITEEHKIFPDSLVPSMKTHLCDSLDIKAKINEFEEFLSSSEGIDNSSQLYQCSPEDYISYLKLKRRKAEADKKLKLKMEKNAMEDAWKKILDNQEMKLKTILSKKLLKQSEYEKQMTLRLKRMRMKYKKFIDNRNIIMDITEKQETVNQFKSLFHTVKIKEMTLVEKQRIKKLHQRLFREKIRLRDLNNLKECRRIAEDIIDYAMIKDDYLKKNGLNMPKNNISELKFLFIKGVRLLSHELTPKTTNDFEDPPITLDVRIHELAECDFHLYMYRVGEWFSKYPEDEPEQLNITGFIVHRLLDLKYNFNVSVGTPADLPSYAYRIFIQRINDTMVLERLKNYLSKFKINVIDVFTVINYFLNAYKVHVGINVLKDLSKSGSPLKSKPTSAGSKKGTEKSTKTTVNLKTKLDKCFQFPSSEEIVKDKRLSETARLGKFVYEILQGGGLLPDTFVCYLIIEYLKILKDISGFILVNYPENITQLAILEYMLTGSEVSFMPIVTDNIRKLMKNQLESVTEKINVNKANITNVEESKTNYLKKDCKVVSPPTYSINELVKLQNSNILPKPNAPSMPPTFESYFTKVILLQREEGSQKKMALKKSQKNMEVEEEIGEEDKVTLENFYIALGISSDFIYRNFDLSTLKRLLRLVLNVSSSQQLEFYKNFDNLANAPVKPTRTEAKKSFLTHVELKKPDLVDWIQEMFACNEEEIIDEMQEEACFEEDISIYPGQKDWEYIEFVISETYAIALATVWESIEYFFINNLKECFGLRRTVENRLMPYRNYIRRKAEECLNLEDDRTQAVTNFQLMLNGIDDKFRSMDTMKNDLHYSTLKLKCNLWRMTDVKKFYCEQVLELIRDQNWITTHQINLLRVYSFILQVESDRFADTLQLIEDYYHVCLLNYTHEERLTKLILPTIVQTGKKKVEQIDKQSNLYKSTASQKKHELKSVKSREVIKSVQESNSKWRTSLYYTDFERQENPVHAMLRSLKSMLVKDISQMKIHCLSKIDNVVAKCNAKIFSEQKGKTGRQKIVNSKGSGDELVNTVLHPNKYSSKIKEKILSNEVFHEWSAAIENETARVLYRVSLIEKRAIANIIDDCTIIENTFKEFEQNIAALYHSQILNIDKVCDLMRAAIEDETKIQPLILLKTDTLEIDRSVILYPNPTLPPPPSLVELQADFKFTISQLTNLFFKLAYVAPFGIVEQTFIQILEDMVCMGHEMGHCYLPNIWSSLSSIQIKDIVHRLFGDKAIIDWRLFIISGLDLDCPTLENILDMKTKFRVLDTNLTETVTYEQYSCVFLWFENAETWSIHKDLHYAKAKELIFKMFQVGENLMNYTDFLLAFCRDVDSSQGIVKALALVEGCATVAWKQDLFHETFQIEKENEKYNVAYGILTILLARVSRIIDSVIITEVSDKEENISEELSFGESPSSDNLKKRTLEGRHRTSQDNADLSGSEDVNSHKISAEEKAITWELNLVEKQQAHILWKSDVYFSMVLSLLLVDIHHFPLSSDNIYDSIDMEENLKQIFISKGTGHSMKLFTLMNHGYFKKLLCSYKCFQTIPLSQMVAKILNEKGPSKLSLNSVKPSLIPR